MTLKLSRLDSVRQACAASAPMFTMAMYSDAYEADDLISAIALWDQLAESAHSFLVNKYRELYNPSLPAIVSAFMPKSGGTFIFNRMRSVFGYLDEFYWGISRKNSHTEVFPTDKALAQYLLGGFFNHTHAQPSIWFRSIVERHNTGPIWVHIRHPAEACLSGYYHWQGKGQGSGIVGEQRVAQIRQQSKFLADKHNFQVGKWPDFFGDSMGFYSNWIESWIQYSLVRPESVFFTWHDELGNLDTFFQRMMAVYGFGFEGTTSGLVISSDRLRVDGTHDWRDGLSACDVKAQAKYLNRWDYILSLRSSLGVQD